MPAKKRNAVRTRHDADETGRLIPVSGKDQDSETFVTSNATPASLETHAISPSGTSREATGSVADAATVAPDQEENDTLAPEDEPHPLYNDSQNLHLPNHQQQADQTAPPGEPQRQPDKSPPPRKTSLTSGGSSTNRSRCSSGKFQQKVVYYQNRFIAIPTGPAPRTAGPASTGAGRGAQGHRGSDSAGGTGTGTAPNGSTDLAASSRDVDGQPRATMNAIVADDSSVTITMHTPDLDPVRADFQGASTSKARAFSSRKHRSPSFLKKIAKFLQDNRLKGGNAETAQKLRTMNKTQNASNQTLKKVLNIIFVTTGVCLLVSVVIVIIYTSFADLDSLLGGKDKNSKTSNQTEVAPLTTEAEMIFERITLAPPADWPYDNNNEWERHRNSEPPGWNNPHDDEDFGFWNEYDDV